MATKKEIISKSCSNRNSDNHHSVRRGSRSHAQHDICMQNASRKEGNVYKTHFNGHEVSYCVVVTVVAEDVLDAEAATAAAAAVPDK